MAWTKTLLTSSLAFITLSRVLVASAFSGNFEISDVWVDSPSQVDATSTANSTVSCKSHTVSVLEAHSPQCTVSLNKHRPAQALHISKLLRIALTNGASFQSSSSMRTLRKSTPSHAPPHGQPVSFHRPNLFQAHVQTIQFTSHSHQAPTMEWQTCTFR